jgi:hypothetical protein
MKPDSRVLSRLGARELTIEETLLVAGSIQFHTLVCTAMHTTRARPGDGDGCNADHDQLYTLTKPARTVRTSLRTAAQPLKGESNETESQGTKPSGRP